MRFLRKTRLSPARPVEPSGAPATSAGPEVALLAGDVVLHRFGFGDPAAGSRKLLVAQRHAVYVDAHGTARAFDIVDIAGLRATDQLVGICLRDRSGQQKGGADAPTEERHVVLCETAPTGFRSTFDLEVALAEAWIRHTGQPFPAADFAGCWHLHRLDTPAAVHVLPRHRSGAA